MSGLLVVEGRKASDSDHVRVAAIKELRLTDDPSSAGVLGAQGLRPVTIRSRMDLVSLSARSRN